MPWPICVREDVAAALAGNRPVVALESTLFAHGLPRPTNLEVAAQIERVVRSEGALPATIGAIFGSIVVGLTASQIERLATSDDVEKAGARDLPVLVAGGRDGATTVAGTAIIANRVGIPVFATGGLGGVHRGARDTWDESADLTTLGRTPITVVSAGVKSILDVAATLERLETLGVTVVGYRTDRFAGFYLADSGFAVPARVESETEVAALMAARDALGLPAAILVANPVPAEDQLDPPTHDLVLAEAQREADRLGIRGKDVTPFLLEYFHEATERESLRVNAEIIVNNARLAARIARAWVQQQLPDQR